MSELILARDEGKGQEAAIRELCASGWGYFLHPV